MGLLDFLQGSLWESFYKKKKEPEFDYEGVIAKSWEIFREGLKNPNPSIRRAVENAVWNVDTPEGKRYFATGMQEPDIENKAYCLKKLYERGGWRLSENILKIAFNDESLSLDEREELVYFLGGFSDPNSGEFLEPGLAHPETRLRIATLCALAGVKNGESAGKIAGHLEGSTDKTERFAAGLALFQYNKPEGKTLIEQAFAETKEPDLNLFTKLKFLDFNKAKIYFDRFSNSTDPAVKIALIRMINDNRGIDYIKQYLNDDNQEVVKRAIEQVIEIGSRAPLDRIKELKNRAGLENTAKTALAVFGDKDAVQELENRARKASLQEEHLEDLNNLALVQENQVSEIIDKLLEPIENLNTISKEETEKVNKAVQILIKYGKMSSIPLLSRYLDLRFLEDEDIARWEVACNSAAAVLLIVERNTTFYTMYKKNKEKG